LLYEHGIFVPVTGNIYLGSILGARTMSEHQQCEERKRRLCNACCSLLHCHKKGIARLIIISAFLFRLCRASRSYCDGLNETNQKTWRIVHDALVAAKIFSGSSPILWRIELKRLSERSGTNSGAIPTPCKEDERCSQARSRSRIASSCAPSVTCTCAMASPGR